MADLRNRLEEAGELRRRSFRAGHELNNVLTALLGTVEVLGLDLGPERQVEVQRLLALVERARGVADGLLSLGADPAAGEADVQRQPSVGGEVGNASGSTEG